MAKGDAERVSWRRVVAVLVIVSAAIWLIGLIVMHVATWHWARQETAYPTASITPQPLSTTHVADLKGGAEVSTFGYVVDLPWKVQKYHDSANMSQLYFSNGAEIGILNMRGVPVGPSAPRESMSSAAADSGYVLLQAELNALPSDISFWHSSKSNWRMMMFLMEKDVVIGKAKVLYSIAAGGMRGFQSGDPKQSHSVWLRLFDSNDRQLWIILQTPDGAGFTQEQINAIVASIRPVT